MPARTAFFCLYFQKPESRYNIMSISSICQTRTKGYYNDGASAKGAGLIDLRRSVRRTATGTQNQSKINAGRSCGKAQYDPQNDIFMGVGSYNSQVRLIAGIGRCTKAEGSKKSLSGLIKFFTKYSLNLLIDLLTIFTESVNIALVRSMRATNPNHEPRTLVGLTT